MQIRQVVQQVFSVDSGLGKRKNVCDLENGETIEDTPLNAKTPWYINQIAVGWVFRASFMKEMHALHNLDATLLAANCIRRLGDKAIDENGNNIIGFFEFQDVLKALFLMSPSFASQYNNRLKNVDFGDGPCLVYINAHTIPPTRHTMVSYVNLVNILAGYPTMHFLRRDAVRALIHRDMSYYTGIGSIPSALITSGTHTDRGAVIR